MRFTPSTLRRYTSISVLNYVCLLICVTLTASIAVSSNAPPGNKSKDNTLGDRPTNVRESYWGPLRLPIVSTSSIVANDPIRFSIQCSKPTVRIGEPIDLTITAELLNISPNLLFFLPGSNAYTLKLLLPPGFEQTGGDFTDYVTGELSYPSRSLMTYHIRGYFRTVTPGTGFRLLRGQGQQNSDQGLFVEKAVVDLKTPPDQSVAVQRGIQPRRNGLNAVTLYVVADTDTGAARLSATTTTASALTVLAPTYNCATGAITFNTSGGDGTTIRYQAVGITAWTTNPNQFLDAGARVDADTPPFTFYVEQSGRTNTYIWSRQAACSTTTPPTTVTTTPPITITVTPPVTTTASALTVLAPTYNCTTGAITFNTSGGDGTTIRYQATGITAWTTNPNQYLDAGSRVNADTPPFTIYVEQSGRTLTYIWSRQAACSTTTPPTTVTTTPPITITVTPPVTITVTPPVTITVTPPVTTTTGGALTVLAPTYNCTTGAITFNTSGGDGTTIRYQATGITAWTTNPNQFLDAGSRVSADTPPFTIYVEQSGRTITYIWSRQAACSTTTPPTTVTTTPPMTTTTASMSNCIAFEPVCSGNIQEVRTLTINVSTAGNYPLMIGYRSPEADIDAIMRVNGVQQSLRLSQTSAYGTVTLPAVPLKAGDNTISLSTGERGGYVCFNSICTGNLPSCAFTASVNSLSATCGQLSIQLTATCTGPDCNGVSYNWSGNSLTYSSQTVYFDAPASNGSFTYTVTASRSGCVDKTATGTVSVTGCGITAPVGVCTINDYSAETDITYNP